MQCSNFQQPPKQVWDMLPAIEIIGIKCIQAEGDYFEME